MQQRLPLAVLKQEHGLDIEVYDEMKVATALTACGIETSRNLSYVVKAYVATALTACGIETSIYSL